MNAQITQYLQYCQTLGHSPRTIVNYTGRLERFRDYLAGPDVRSITREDVDAYHDHLLASNLALGSRIGMLSTVRAFLSWLHENGLILTDVAALVDCEKRTPQVLEMPLTESEMVDLLEMVPPEDYRGRLHRAILEVLYGCGLRRAEAAGLRLRDLDLIRRMLTVRGKGDKERTVPIPGAALHYLGLYLAARTTERSVDVLFVKESGQPIKPSDIDNLFGKLRKGFPRNVRPHLLRHSYAVHMLRGGADVRVLQALLGHESIDDTARYLRLVKEDVRAAYDAALEGVL